MVRRILSQSFAKLFSLKIERKRYAKEQQQ